VSVTPPSTSRTTTPQAVASVLLLALGLTIGLGLAELALRVWSHTDTPLARALAEWDPDAVRIDLLGSHCFRGHPHTALLRVPTALRQVAYVVNDAATTERCRDAIAGRRRRFAADFAAAGRRAEYVAHALPDAAFLDDCHLTADGNRMVAERFAEILVPAGSR
jgi:hypothetical protein